MKNRRFYLLSLLEQYGETLEDDQLFPSLHVCSDGSGKIVNGEGKTLAEFDNEIELEACLTQ